MIELEAMEAEARRVGFELLGVAPVEAAGHGWFAPHVERFEAWLEAGRDADMPWLRARMAERCVPEELLPGVRSAIALWLNHRCPAPARPDHPTARVAAYAWGRDYHNVARKALRKLRRWMLRVDPEVKTYLSIDTGAVLERAFAERAAVGWIGRSTMLIPPTMGTFGSLAIMFVDRTLPSPEAAHPYRCGTCTACVEACPTGALDAAGLDAGKCISYWTIEHRGVIPREMRSQLGEWVFGCDVCQDVCPWNRDAPRADPQRWRPVDARAWPRLIEWVESSSEALHAGLEGSPLRRARGEGLRRNALIALANGGHLEALPQIQAVLREEKDPSLRATAAWAALTLGDESARAVAAADPHPLVVAESR